MNLKKREYLLRSIRHKDAGQVEWVAGMFFVLILVIMMHTQLQLASWSSVAVYLEDALAASNLASALVDVEEYGKSNKVFVGDAQAAYEVYKDAVQANLGLDEQWECRNKSFITGPVEIVNYTIYNVDGNVVETVRVGADGQVSERRTGALGTVVAPDGTVVEHTGVYSELQFPVTGFLDITVKAHKGKLVDIVSVKGEADENG